MKQPTKGQIGALYRLQRGVLITVEIDKTPPGGHQRCVLECKTMPPHMYNALIQGGYITATTIKSDDPPKFGVKYPRRRVWIGITSKGLDVLREEKRKEDIREYRKNEIR